MGNALNSAARRSRDAFDLSTCSLDVFASAVHSAIRRLGHAPTERYHGRKVFASAIHAQLGGERVISVGTFRVRLIAANRAGLLDLARADLVAAMDQGAVMASEFSHLNSTFHFVLDRNHRDAWEVR